MTPTKSNLNKENCSPISSNCVIWQGPDISCINLCNGDSISEVTYKIAEELCAVKESFGFTDVDLTCLLTICSTSPEPQKTITNILNLIINKVCCLSDIVNNIDITVPAEIEIRLASCFNITNPQGVPLTSLPQSEYVYQIGVLLCNVVNTQASQGNAIATLQNQVATLIATPAPTIPQVTPDCVLPPVPTDIDLVVDELENQYCQLVSVLGSPSDLTKVLGKQCTDLNNQDLLSSGNPIVTLGASWVTTPTVIAHTMINMWAMICDLRGAVKIIQDNCCKVTCNDIVVDFDIKRTVNDNGDLVLLLFFHPKTTMPDTWYDCNQKPTVGGLYPWVGNEITITDEAGHVFTTFLQLRNAALDNGILEDPTYYNQGYEINLGNSPLDEMSAYVLESNLCITDGSTNCTKCLYKDIPYVKVDTGCCVITATDTVTLTYRICPTTTTSTTIIIG